MSSRQLLPSLLGVVVASVAAYLALKDIDAQALFAALASAQYFYVVPSLALSALGYAVRAWRWQIIIAPARQIPLRAIFPTIVIGFAWNVAIPLRIGELVRAHLLGQRYLVSRSTLLATIVVERVLDGVGIMAILSLVAWLSPDLPEWAGDLTRAAWLLFGAAVAGLILVAVSESFALAVLKAITTHLPRAVAGRIDRLALSFVQGFSAVRSPARLLQLAVSTLAVWFVEVASYAVLFPAFGLRFDAAGFISAACFYAVVLNLSTLIPSSPGFIGTMQYFGKLALSAFGIEPALALSMSVVSHAVQLAVVALLGAWALWHEGLSLKGLKQVTAQVE
ncbi:MAG: flippase-like domain-containing protein [Chloroflexi bacterium]|nr:flippase-like domain-containing protein [Chloroflexota bacterium]